MFSYRIVLVDNDSVSLGYLRQMVSRLGHVVVGEASDAITGITTIRATQPHVVIIDSQLNNSSALELAQIVAGDRLAGLILIASDANDNLMLRMKEFWACEVLSHPIAEQNLNLAIEMAHIRFDKASQLEKEINELKETIESKKLLDKAKALLMRKMGMSEEQAYKHIQQLAMKKRVTKKAVSEALILALDD